MLTSESGAERCARPTFFASMGWRWNAGRVLRSIWRAFFEEMVPVNDARFLPRNRAHVTDPVAPKALRPGDVSVRDWLMDSHVCVYSHGHAS